MKLDKFASGMKLFQLQERASQSLKSQKSQKIHYGNTRVFYLSANKFMLVAANTQYADDM